MSARAGGRQRVVHQRSSDAELAAGRIDRQRAQHQRRNAPGADVPQPHGPDQPALAHDRKSEAFGGRASVAQALAGAHMAVCAKAGIEQRLARNDVRGTFRTDHERSSAGEGNGVFRKSSHGTSVLASGGGEASEALSADLHVGEREPADRLPIVRASERRRQMW